MNAQAPLTNWQSIGDLAAALVQKETRQRSNAPGMTANYGESAMTLAMPNLNELFNIPEQSTGEYITKNIRSFIESHGICREGEGWVQIKDWIIGLSHNPNASEDIFGAPRSDIAKAYAESANAWSSPASQVVDAMCAADSIIRHEGPLESSGMGHLPLHFIISAIGGVKDLAGFAMTPEAIIYMAADFAILGRAVANLTGDAA